MAKKVTAAKFAELTHVVRCRVYEWIKEGRLPSAEKPGRDWLIDPDDADLPAIKDRKSGYPRGKPRVPKDMQSK